MSLRDIIPSAFHSAIRFDEPMSRHTSWHVGGPADAYFTPHSAEELSGFLDSLPETVPVHWLGLGSNVLIRDGGIRGVVISLHLGVNELQRIDETHIRAEAGVPCARIARQCARWLLGPAEFFAGIPGTVGGALAMNAGAWGEEIWPHVVEVEIVNRSGQRLTRQASEYQYGYRHVMPPAMNEWFVAARLQFRVDANASQSRIRDLLEARRAKQPIGAWSCGSTFTNPVGDYAARLIEASGLKGASHGGASVSEKHANFLINTGDATADDIEQLINRVQAEVLVRQGVRLETEVRILGEHS
jgi:UDP-N-acetylmuramate dehydrogenase